MTQCHKASRWLLASVLALACLALLGGCRTQATPERIALRRPPFLGLACDSTTYPCRRLGLAVWLPPAAHAVTADVDGRSVRLTSPAAPGERRDPAFWQGFFRDARAERYCEQYPHALAVTIHLSAPNGDGLVASSRPVVSCGYG